VSQEAPVILLREDKQEIRLGGAANVANMLIGLQAQVTMAGIVGDDADGKLVKDELASVGVNCSAVHPDASRPTTVKERFLGRAQNRHPHQMLRVDRESRELLNVEVEQRLIESILASLNDQQAVLISDYAKGVCTPKLLSSVIEACREKNIPVIVDPSSNGNCVFYKNATAITPNRLETSRATGLEIRTIEDAFQAGKKLCESLDLDHAFITIDSDGVALCKADGTAEHFPTRKREVYDITGAGDMVLATIGVGAAAGVTPEDLARLANIAGGLEVEQIGVVTISREELIADLLAESRKTNDKICDADTLARHVAARKSLGQKIVLTNGCFDLLHIGHVGYLEQSAQEGDCLVVAINSDSSVRGLGKGDDRPIFNQEHRSAMLAALEVIDYVTVFEESTPHAILEKIKPDVLVKGGTYSSDEIVGKDIVEGYGGTVKALGITPGISTTQILTIIRDDQTLSGTTNTEVRKAG
jgi:D-beta-D-heptose 7-phosphate kinase/D-beta-D-heptose 1-phosphate adenosyltransferase